MGIESDYSDKYMSLRERQDSLHESYKHTTEHLDYLSLDYKRAT